MNQFYKELPDIYNSYIKPNALDIINSNRQWKNLHCHDLFRVHKSELLTAEGLTKFSSYGNYLDVFRVPPNFASSTAHIDKSFNAFNFILTKNGYMEWFDREELVDSHKSDWSTPNFTVLNSKSIMSTRCSAIWVNTRIPHRIVNDSDSERICVSIRSTFNVMSNL